MTILKSWRRQTEKRIDTLEITAEKVYLACDEGEDALDSAIGCTRAEFLAGRLNGMVAEIFGKAVLREALAYLRLRH